MEEDRMHEVVPKRSAQEAHEAAMPSSFLSVG